jgi:hypothetical protein
VQKTDFFGGLVTVQDFRCEDLDLAPQGVGVYAWYLDPVLRPADLADHQSTRENLLRLAEQLKLPRFDVKARGHLSLMLEGNLDHTHLASENSGEFSQLVESVLQSEVKREIFAEILRGAVPHLMAPLYIGVATNIRERLRQHRQEIDHFRQLLRLGPKEVIFEDAKQRFALEVVRRGIPSRRLRVFTSTIVEQHNNPEENRQIAEAVETILNRLFYPIMGRR